MRHTLWRLALALLAAGAPAACRAATITVDIAAPGPPVSDLVRGLNMANWFDPTPPQIRHALRDFAIRATRWPGGSMSDRFHWQAGTECGGGYVDPHAGFAAFLAGIVKPLALDLEVTLDYGSNPACDGGGAPAEAAGWVRHARTLGVTGAAWTVGNEVYGDWEYDLHARPHDAATYASAVAEGFYPAIRQADATAKVGVVVSPGWPADWDRVVLAGARYDYVDLHWYAQAPGWESDDALLRQAPGAFADMLRTLRAELAAAGHGGTPIHLGELGSVAAKPGRQTSSITQALFAGQILGELMNAGVARATWWLGFGGCSDAQQGNFSAGLYGWQSFGGYMVFSDGTPEYGCRQAPVTALGTPLPTAWAFALAARVIRAGAHVLQVGVDGDADVRAYAASQGDGAALLVFNLDRDASHTATIRIGTRAAREVTVSLYDRAIYDRSRDGAWDGATTPAPVRQPLTLPPWSMMVAVVR